MTALQTARTDSSAGPRLFLLELSGDRIHSMNIDGSERKILPDGIVVDARPVISNGPTWVSPTSTTSEMCSDMGLGCS
jgi:hypothetical protein